MDAHRRGFLWEEQGRGESVVFLEQSKKEREEWLSSPLLMKLPVPHALPFIRGVPGQEGGGQAWGREPRAPE